MSTEFTEPAAFNPMPARKPKLPIVIPSRVAERAAVRCVKAANGCLISTYSVASHGYAQIGWTDKDGGHYMVLCHRAAWVHHHGMQIPDGMTIDHLCKNRQCVNPDHLRLLSNFENARRTNGDDWPLGVCKHGHPNARLKRRKSGRWECQDCRRMYSGQHRSRKRQQVAQEAF